MNLINTIESMKKVFLFVAAVLLCLACNEAGRTVDPDLGRKVPGRSRGIRSGYEETPQIPARRVLRQFRFSSHNPSISKYGGIFSAEITQSTCIICRGMKPAYLLMWVPFPAPGPYEGGHYRYPGFFIGSVYQ